MSAEEFRFEIMNVERVGNIKFLYKDAFLTDVSEDFLRQKHNTNFTGVNFIVYIAYYAKNTTAAYYGIYPLYFTYKNALSG